MNKLIFVLMLLFSTTSFGKTVFPKTVNEFKNTSVKILNLEMTSGGTGSIYRSYKNSTHLLTNKHVCRGIEQGGVVDYKNKQYPITHYKKFKDHDLCFVRIDKNLNINLKVASSLAKESSKSVVSGHPSLLPHIVTVGHLSERQDIELIVGIKRCTPKDMEEDPVSCMWFGGKPVVETLDSQLISNLIKPGNSGSAVFDSNGEIIGVVFAGMGRDFSYGFIVPHLYLIYFIQNAHRFEWVKVGTKVDDNGMYDRVFNFDKCEEARFKGTKFKKINEFCKRININMIWKK